MIWLTWRQLRASVLALGAALAVLATALALTGPGLATTYSKGIAACTADDSCGRFYDRFFDQHELAFSAVTLLVLLLPVLVGLFWGAPLLTRELETGTHLLVWNQSITRARWLAVKLAVTGLAATAAAVLAGLAVTWWSGPLDRSAPGELAVMSPLVFSARGIVPVGYAVFAFVLGATVGMLVRRTLPAMAVTLAVFVALQLAVPALVRPHLMPAVTSTVELSEANIAGLGREADGPVHLFLRSGVPGHPGAWLLTNELVDPSGRTIDERAPIPVSMTSGPCAPGPGGLGACTAEIGRLGYRQRATYQPLERFWAFQWMETGIYAGLSLGLTWLSFRWMRRRPS
jgi:ABC-type transport system involved in multi-copper enzyme maturation permease subunit